MARPAEPEYLIMWREQRKTPHCCHTCAFYSEDGYCNKFGEAPPAEFANAHDKCQAWEDEVPFICIGYA